MSDEKIFGYILMTLLFMATALLAIWALVPNQYAQVLLGFIVGYGGMLKCVEIWNR